jgi:hypothetical protein
MLCLFPLSLSCSARHVSPPGHPLLCFHGSDPPGRRKAGVPPAWTGAAQANHFNPPPLPPTPSCPQAATEVSSDSESSDNEEIVCLSDLAVCAPFRAGREGNSPRLGIPTSCFGAGHPQVAVKPEPEEREPPAKRRTGVASSPEDHQEALAKQTIPFSLFLSLSRSLSLSFSDEPHRSPRTGVSKTFAAQYFCQNLDS